MAASLAGVVGARPTLVARGLVAVPLAWMLALNGADVGDYQAAVRDGHQLLAQLDRDLPVIPQGGVLVVPPLPNRGGVAMFILASDLSARLQFERDVPTAPPIRVALDGEDLRLARESYRYDRLTRQVTERGEGR